MDTSNIDKLDPREQFLETRKIAIEGMNCDQCVQKVETALGQAQGVKQVQVDLNGRAATVTYDTRETDIPQLHDLLLQSGFKPAPQDEG